MSGIKESKLSKLWTNDYEESKLWTSELLKSVNVSSLSDLTPQSFVKCRSMTRDVLANRLCEALKLIDGCQKKIVELKNSYDQLNKQFFFLNNFNFNQLIIHKISHKITNIKFHAKHTRGMYRVIYLY